jgi:16S rRNA (adenine1518-N6/adenine1519-N6)-dimethyltransferase
MKRRRLGQHYLVDPEAVRKVIAFADVKPFERVVEIGTGKGALTKELACLGASFTGYEVDASNFAESSEAVLGSRARIFLADAFEQNPQFDVLVASIPYSRSATFVEWLSSIKFGRAVVVLQEDFIRKLLAPPGDRDFRGISAVAQVALGVKVLEQVDRRSFSPPPRVNSVVASIVPRRRIPKAEVLEIIRLFSLRRRQVDSALAQLGMKSGGGYGKRRVYSLEPDEIHRLCRPAGSA